MCDLGTILNRVYHRSSHFDLLFLGARRQMVIVERRRVGATLCIFTILSQREGTSPESLVDEGIAGSSQEFVRSVRY